MVLPRRAYADCVSGQVGRIEDLDLAGPGRASRAAHVYKPYWFHWATGLEMSFHLHVGWGSHKIRGKVSKLTYTVVMVTLNLKTNKQIISCDYFTILFHYFILY